MRCSSYQDAHDYFSETMQEVGLRKRTSQPGGPTLQQLSYPERRGSRYTKRQAGQV
jgi:hypothetical protein